MKYRPIAILMLLLVTSAFGEDTKALEARLSRKLQNGYLMLRVPRSGQKLRFSEDGSSKNPIGIRGFDDLVQVTSVKLAKNELVLKGPRLQNGYSVKDQTVELTRSPDAIEIHLAVNDSTSEAAIAKSYNSVFLRTEEIPRRTCTDYKYLAETMSNFHTVAKEEKDKKEAKRPTVPDRDSREVCLPSGAVGWLIG